MLKVHLKLEKMFESLNAEMTLYSYITMTQMHVYLNIFTMLRQVTLPNNYKYHNKQITDSSIHRHNSCYGDDILLLPCLLRLSVYITEISELHRTR